MTRYITAFSLAALLLAGVLLYGNKSDEAQINYVLGDITEGDIESVVVTTGTLEALNTIVVGSQLSGQIAELYVDFNDVVEADQLLARIDPRTFEARVKQNEADVRVAEASIQQRDADVVRARALHSQAQRELKRREDLREEDYASASELDQDLTTVETTNAQVKMAEAAVANARAVHAQRLAMLSQSQLDLERTMIRSPVAGTVINRTIELGQTVAASLQAPELFQIAQDLHEMKVEASVDEADIGRIKEEMVCRFSVDAYPERKFRGLIQQIRKAPDKVQNVVTYRVIITASNNDLALFPGMTTNVEIVLGSREGVLQVPNAALRYAPKGLSQESESSSPGGRGNRGDLLQRLKTELELSALQETEIESLVSDMQKEARRMVESGDRASMRTRMPQLRVNMNSKISVLLNPAQQRKFDQMSRESPRRRPTSSRPGTVWQLIDGEPKQTEIQIGLADNQVTEVVEGMSEGDKVIVRAIRNPD
jgi:HlyD family secretion protein